MKKLTLLFVTSCLALHLHAQQDTQHESLNAIKIERAITKKKIGIALTSVGCGSLAVGLLALSNSNTYIVLDVAFVLVGAGFLGVGIPLWCVGTHQKRKWSSSEGISLSLTPHLNGMTLRLRF